MKKVSFLACFLLICAFGWAQTSSNPIGIWNFDLPDAPAEYATGKIEFKNEDGKLMLLNVGAPQGSGFEVTKKDGKYICNISIQGFDLTYILEPDGDNLKGIVSTDYGDLPIFLKPDKK